MDLLHLEKKQIESEMFRTHDVECAKCTDIITSEQVISCSLCMTLYIVHSKEGSSDLNIRCSDLVWPEF